MQLEVFYVSADSHCNFNEPNPRDENILTAYILVPITGKKLYDKTNILHALGDYVFLPYPHYYRGLCALAKKMND